MSKKDAQMGIEETPDSFPVTLEEFLTGLPVAEHEKKSAFGKLMRKEQITGHRTHKEWQEMYQRFGKMPVGTPWQK